MKGRLYHLDGLRGVAAVIVVVYHLGLAFLPWLTTIGDVSTRPWVVYTPLAALWCGPMAVMVFFVLSGFVVANATIRKSDPIWVDIVIRYLRLAVPATLSVLFAWALLSAIPEAATRLAVVTDSAWLPGAYQGSIPGLANAFLNGTVGIFIGGHSMYNNVLWTMSAELVGSFICFVVCLAPSARLRVMAALGFMVAIPFCHRYHLLCFVFGILLREAWAAGRLKPVFPLAIFGLGLMGCTSESIDLGTYLSGFIPAVVAPKYPIFALQPIAGALIVYGCMQSAWLRSLLDNPTGRFLGMISFPLYLIHVPLMVTLLAALWVAAQPSVVLMAGSILIYALLVLGLSVLAERAVERPLLLMLAALRTRLARFAVSFSDRIAPSQAVRS